MEWLAIALGIVCIPLLVRQIQERDEQDKLKSHDRTAANDNKSTAQEQMAADTEKLTIVSIVRQAQEEMRRARREQRTAQEQMAIDFSESAFLSEGYHPRADFIVGLGTPPVRRRRCRCCGKELT